MERRQPRRRHRRRQGWGVSRLDRLRALNQVFAEMDEAPWSFQAMTLWLEKFDLILRGGSIKQPTEDATMDNASEYIKALNRAAAAEINAKRYLKLREKSALVAGMNGGVGLSLGAWEKSEEDKEALDAAVDAMPE